MIKYFVIIMLCMSNFIYAGGPARTYSYHSGSMSRGYSRYNPNYGRPDINYVRPNNFRGFDSFSNGRMVSRSIGVDRGQYFIFRK